MRSLPPAPAFSPFAATPLALSLLALPLLAFSPLAAQTNPQPVFVSSNGPAPGPFSPAVKVGNLIFVAGHIGTGPDGKVVAGGIGPETKQTMENIRAIVEKAGSDMEHVVKCTAFLADMKEWGAMNEVYRTFFRDGKYPARSAFGSTGLARDARVEIECIATAK